MKLGRLTPAVRRAWRYCRSGEDASRRTAAQLALVPSGLDLRLNPWISLPEAVLPIDFGAPAGRGGLGVAKVRRLHGRRAVHVLDLDGLAGDFAGRLHQFIDTDVLRAADVGRSVDVGVH